MEGEAAGGGVADQLDLDAAEQLIQLSGGDGVSSESRSADSVKCCAAEDRAAGIKEEKEVVESRPRRSPERERHPLGKDGNAGEPDRISAAESVNKSSNRAAGMAEKGNTKKQQDVESRRRNAQPARFLAVKKDGGAGVVHDDGEERKRPRFRRLSDIYRETRQLVNREPRSAGGNVVLSSEAERRKRKRAADGADEVVGPVPVAPKASKARTMVA